MATLIVGWLCAFHDPVEGGGSIFSLLRNGSFVIMEPSKSEDSQTQTETQHCIARAISYPSRARS
ncbi:hypothetical protein M407DRAFT_241255 [Tulasnella calospora MUT 4182]|uniref:Uncharacterized protein n=1 Tax=Tulasnella calospora MUT 4182 TaxID=1051891 RepID=A0A0C3QK35_9AGAM|nr:hypothetical protein M407DRAFT_241255 [Tulasnella calospora MUT 4182]